MNTDKLLLKAKEGTITDQEIQQVVSALKQQNDKYDKYTLIHIIGRSFKSEYEPLVASYLHSPEDPMLARIALISLCDYFGKTEKYLVDVLQFINGVHWDDEEDVRLVAISAVGEFLRRQDQKDKFVLTLLIDIFDNSQESEIIKGCVYSALGRAYGLDWNELPLASQTLDFDKDINHEILEQVKNDISARD